MTVFTCNDCIDMPKTKLEHNVQTFQEIPLVILDNLILINCRPS